MDNHRRFMLPVEVPARQPLAVESIGINPAQEDIRRDDGYPFFHWLQTLSGEGKARFAGRTVLLPPHTGLLLFPGDPHVYEATDGLWQTAYVTFGGSLAAELAAALGIHASSFFRLPPEAGVEALIRQTIERLERHGDAFGVETSSAAYRLLVTLARFGETGMRSRGRPARIRKLQDAVDWMENHCADPDAGISQMAEALHLSERRLTSLFRESFDQSPHAYFIRLRIRRAKELLHAYPHLTVREIAERVGFRDVSHFTATFRKQTGITPAKFRKNR